MEYKTIMIFRVTVLSILSMGISAQRLYNQGDIPIGILSEVEDGFGLLINNSINQYNQRQNFQIVPQTRETNSSNALSVRTQVCEMLSKGVYVLMGAENATSEPSIVSITEQLHMPYITFSDQDMNDMTLNYKLKMTPSYVEILAALEKHYQWEHVFYLYNDHAGLSRFERFHDFVDDEDVELDARYLDPHLPNYYDVLRNLDKKYSNKREFNEKVLILDLFSDNQTQIVLDQMVDVGMTRENYHIIPATLSVYDLNLERLQFGGVTVTGFQLAGLKTTNYSEELVLDGLRVINKAMGDVLLKNEDEFTRTIQAGEMMNGGVPGIPCHLFENFWLKGDIIMNAMKKVRFNGRTGRVQFDRNGKRINYSFDVLQQTMNTRISKVGSWNQTQGLNPMSGMRETKRITRDRDGYYNKTIIITTILTEPFAMIKSNAVKNLTGNERYEGYAIDLVEELAKIIRFRYEIREEPNGAHGNKQPNGSWNGMIGDLVAKKADMAIGDLTITSDRERAVDFSTPFMNLGISIMIKKPEKQKPSVFSFMEPLSNTVWYCITVSFVCVGIVIYVVARLSPSEWKVEEDGEGTETVSNEFSIQNSFWFVAGAIMCQGSELSPEAPSARMVGSGWWFFTLIVISSYTANLAAFLTVETIIIPIKDVADLANHETIKYGTLASGTTRRFFENSTNPFYQMMWKTMKAQTPSVLAGSTSEGIERVRNSKGRYAFLVESVTNEFANQKKPCNTMKVGENLDSKSYGVATYQGHRLRHAVTMAILRLHETGTLKNLQQLWWYEKGQCNNQESASPIKALSLSNVAGVFYILISGLLIAMLCALFEFIIKSCKDAKKYKKSLRSSMKSKAKLSIAGESDDSPYAYLPRPTIG